MLEAETRWMWTLKTIAPGGLNLNDGYHIRKQ
jgi:hypothetical protein